MLRKLVCIFFCMSLALAACASPAQDSGAPEGGGELTQAVPSQLPTYPPTIPPTETAAIVLSTPTLAESPATITAPTQAAEAGPVNLTYIQMESGGTGWGLAQEAVLRTQNGGRGWLNVSPPGGFPPGSFLRAYFLDAATGWVMAGNPGEGDSGQLFHTADAGQSWESFSTPFPDGQLFFIDPQNGWALVGRGAAAGSMAVDLYHTTDSGAAWTLVHSIDPQKPEAPGSLPLGGSKNGIAFRDSDHGWLAGSLPVSGSVYLFSTADGGKTWQPQELLLPASYAEGMASADPPRFFSDQEGVLPVRVAAQDLALLFYVTQDGGATWTATTPAPVSGAYDLLSPREFIAWDGARLAVSQDGGITWAEQTTNIDLSGMLLQIDFTDLQNGWALSQNAAGQSSLYLTTDGGATWSPVP